MSSSASRSSSSLQAPSTPPILKSPNSRIQKQISLYERGSGSMTQPDQTCNNNKCSPSARRNAEFYRFLSVDQRSISDTEDNVLSSQHEWEQRSNRTKSCANLKISCAHQSAPHSPGAVLIKEKYIDMPKRVARSFHGKTDAETTDICVPNGQQKTKPRFTTSRVNESTFNDNNNSTEEQWIKMNGVLFAFCNLVFLFLFILISIHFAIKFHIRYIMYNVVCSTYVHDTYIIIIVDSWYRCQILSDTYHRGHWNKNF